MSALLQADLNVAVVIPAHNEATSIAACLRSVIEARRRCTQLAGFWIFVVADRCSDDTAEVARREVAGYGEVLTADAGSAGAARRIGCDAALLRYSRDVSSQLWLANTDADTQVSRDWLQVQVQAARDGVAALAGVVTLHAESACARTLQLFNATYEIGTDGVHTHVHGANLGVSAHAYGSVGGWFSVALGEDHCLWQRLRASGWPVRADAASVVTTSGRLQGRAPGGFADTLRHLVEGPRASVV